MHCGEFNSDGLESCSFRSKDCRRRATNIVGREIVVMEERRLGGEFEITTRRVILIDYRLIIEFHLASPIRSCEEGWSDLEEELQKSKSRFDSG